MNALHMVTLGMWLQQDPDSLSSGNSRLLMIFVGVVAVSMLAQAIIFIAMAIGAAKARKRMLDIVEEVRAKAMPMISSAQDLIHDTTPKIRVITENLVETSHIVRSKAAEFDATATDLNEKTRAQVAKVDGIVSSVLQTTSDVSDTIQRGIRIPVREFSGLVNGLKAGLDVLVGRSKTPVNGNGSVGRTGAVKVIRDMDPRL